MPSDFFPLFVYFVVALAIGGLGLVGVSAILGPKKPTAEKLSTYECGVEPVGSPRDRFPIKFYVIGMLFILFDIEVVFLYPWASMFDTFTQADTWLFGYAEMGTFLGILMFGFIYVWRKGALEWD